MERPKPGAAHARLHKLAGHWGGEERLHPSPMAPAGGMADAVVLNRVVLGGFAVVQDYEQYVDGKLTFSGHGMFWWDDRAKHYVMTWFDSMMGRPAEFRGDFDGDVLRLTNAMPQGGFSRCSFDYGLPGEYVFVMEVSLDGRSWLPAMEGAYTEVRLPTRPAVKKVARKSSTKRAAPKKAAKTAKSATRKTSAPKKSAPKKGGRQGRARQEVVEEDR